jgi:hypothetical protein
MNYTNKTVVRYSYLFFFYFLQNSVFAQQLMDKEYYNYINSAELRIVDSDYWEALHFYDKAFQEKKIPFAKDRYNASVCAALLKMNLRCYSELRHVLDKGYAIANIKSKDVFYDFFKTDFGNKLIKYNQTSKKTYISTYRETLDSLFNADQFFRNKEGKYVLYIDTIRKIDRSNVDLLNKLISKYGFPSEELIGVSDSSFIPITYRILIIHQQSGSQTRVFDYTDIIKNALEEGKIEAHLAAELISKSSGNDLYGIYESSGLIKCVLDSLNSVAGLSSNPNANYDGVKWGYLVLSPEREAEINLNRSKLGLESISDSRAKSIFLLKDKRFDFALPSSNSIFLFENKKEYEKALEKIILIK